MKNIRTLLFFKTPYKTNLNFRHFLMCPKLPIKLISISDTFSYMLNVADRRSGTDQGSGSIEQKYFFYFLLYVAVSMRTVGRPPAVGLLTHFPSCHSVHGMLARFFLCVFFIFIFIFSSTVGHPGHARAFGSLAAHHACSSTASRAQRRSMPVVSQNP